MPWKYVSTIEDQNVPYKVFEEKLMSGTVDILISGPEASSSLQATWEHWDSDGDRTSQFPYTLYFYVNRDASYF